MALKISESYLVSIDVSEDDESLVMVTRMEGRNIKFIKQFRGEEAIKVYELLTVKE